MRLLSGRVGVTSYAGLSTYRKQTPDLPGFLSLSEAEPNLGLPDNNDQVLYGGIDGSRYWGAAGGAPSGSVDGITVQEDGVTPVGYGGSVSIVNFTGNGVDVTEAKYLQSGVTIGVSTVLINKSVNEVSDANDFVRATGITTFKVGYGLSYIEEPGKPGIVSIFSAGGAQTKMQNEDGTDAFTNVSTMRIGYGMTVSQVSIGIASLGLSGQVENWTATGIVTSGLGFKGDLVGAGVTATSGITGNLTGNVTGDLTGDSAGTHTGRNIGHVTGDINSVGVSTLKQVYLDTIQATGIVTTAAGFIAPVGSFGFLGSLNSTGISTVAFFNGTNINVSGIATAAGGFVAGVGGVGGSGFTGRLTGDVTGNVNAAGISTIPQLLGTTGNFTGVVTASRFVGSFTGDITGDVTGAASQITLSNEGTDTTCYPVMGKAPTGNKAPVTNTNLVFNSSNGTLSATTFSGSGASLTNLPSGNLTGALPTLDGSALTDVDAARVELIVSSNTNATHYPTFVDTVNGTENVRTDADFRYNPGTNVLTAGTFDGPSTGLTGTPSISVTDITLNGNMEPDVDATRNLGSASKRWANVHTADMHFNNTGTGGNDIDGTEGHWILQEGLDNIYMINKKTGKKYKIALTEV